MGIRAGGDPLAAVVPDLEQLAADPRRYLTEGPLLFGPRSFYGLAALFGLPGIGFLIAWQLNPAETERLALGIACLIGAAIWLYHSLSTAGHSLLLGPSGVEVRYRDTTVFCPWDLFDVDGDAWTGPGESPSTGMAIPVQPAAVPEVVWRRGVIELARGLNVRAPQAWFLSPQEMILPARYELRGADLAKLLMLIGTRLGGRLAANRAPSSEPAAEEEPRSFAHQDRPVARKGERTADAAPVPDKDGFYAVSLARFDLPPCCIVCAGEPETTLFLRQFGVEVPVCKRCHAAEMARMSKTLLGWMTALGLVGMLGGLAAPPEARFLAVVLGGSLASFVGLWIGTLVGLPRPIELRDYQPTLGVLRIRFKNPEVAKRYEQWQAQRR